MIMYFRRPARLKSPTARLSIVYSFIKNRFVWGQVSFSSPNTPQTTAMVTTRKLGYLWLNITGRHKEKKQKTLDFSSEVERTKGRLFTCWPGVQRIDEAASMDVASSSAAVAEQPCPCRDGKQQKKISWWTRNSACGFTWPITVSLVLFFFCTTWKY